jgi:multiple sugar transport system permease protein
MSPPVAQEQALRSEAPAKVGTVFTKFHKFLRRKPMLAFLLCAPLIALVLGLIVYPFFYSIWLSLLNKRKHAS